MRKSISRTAKGSSGCTRMQCLGSHPCELGGAHRSSPHNRRLEMPKHLFPEVDRVVYGKSPLIEVICQVRFPADLRIETTPPVDFQRRVRDQFPMLAQQNQAMLSDIPAELAKTLASVLPPTGGSTTWVFSTEDRSHTLELQRDKLTLVSPKLPAMGDFLLALSAGV